MTKQEYINHNVNELFKYWLVQATAWGSLAFLSLSLLDYVSTPENFGLFLRYRITAAVLLIAVAVIAWKGKKRGIIFHQALAYVAVFCSAATIELMILRFGGHESPYYVGMILLCVMVVGFMPGSFYFYVMACLLIYGVYIMPLMLKAPVTDTGFFYTANGFLIIIIAALLLIKHLSGQRLQTEFSLRYDLEQHQKQLEKTVEERTAELTDAVSKLSAEIEERKRIDREMKLLNEQLRRSQKMEAVGLLAGGIAHDFNTILATIKGCGYILRKRMKAEDPLSAYVEQILSSLKRGTGLTQNLLAFSRQQGITLKSLDVNQIVMRAKDLLSHLAGEEVSVDVKCSEGALTVLADRMQMEQVLMNLVTNARDAMAGSGQILISTGIAGADPGRAGAEGIAGQRTYAVLSVSDTGKGMDMVLQERIFDPFFTTKEFGTGSGLGLAIVYGIIRDHNGFITLDSAPRKGTTFRIHLPLAP